MDKETGSSRKNPLNEQTDWLATPAAGVRSMCLFSARRAGGATGLAGSRYLSGLPAIVFALSVPTKVGKERGEPELVSVLSGNLDKLGLESWAQQARCRAC